MIFEGRAEKILLRTRVAKGEDGPFWLEGRVFAKTRVAKGSVISGKCHTRKETSGMRLSQQTEDDLKERRG